MDTQELLNEFKKMSLSKQGLVTVCTITLIVVMLQNKNFKDTSLKFLDNLTNDESVKGFMSKIEILVKKIAEAIRQVVGLNKEEASEQKEQEKQQIND